MCPAAHGTINNPSVGGDAPIAPPYRTPCNFVGAGFYPARPGIHRTP